MPLNNRYQKFSKISERKFRVILQNFALDFTASDTARLTAISIRSVNTIFLKLRKRIAQECEKQAPFNGVIEIDESYFGPRRIRGKRGRGAGGKTIVFGIFKRDDNIYTEIVPDASKASLCEYIFCRRTVSGQYGPYQKVAQFCGSTDSTPPCPVSSGSQDPPEQLPGGWQARAPTQEHI